MFFHDRRRYVTTRIWDTETHPGSFPELHDPELKCDWVIDRRNFGVCFSGGGSRSAAATLGQLRGLRASGLLDRLGYISSVSGGSWASTPFTFLPNRYTDDGFLGPMVEPEQMGLFDLDFAPAASFARVIAESVIGDDFILNALRLGGDETYARAVGNLFLEPYGLNDHDRFFTFHEAALTSALADNAGDDRYFLTREDFYLAREGRPYLIAGGTLLRERNNNPAERKLQCEYTPIYTGVRHRQDVAGRRGRPIEGGYISTYAYDSASPESAPENDKCTVKLGRRRFRFALSDMIGSSGAAPAETVRGFGATFLGFPEFRHWPIVNIGQTDSEEYAHGDGGHLENFGIMPLLARGVGKIIVFINTPTRFHWNPRKPQPRKKTFTDDLAPLFGRSDSVNRKKNEEKLTCNQVFEKAKLDDLLQAFAKCRDQKRPLIYADTDDIMENPHFKIRSYTAKVCWVYNHPVPRWADAIADDEVKDVLEKDRQFKRFPNYRTFGENPPKLIDLSVRQVNMLAHLSSWIVDQKSDYLVKELDL